MYNMVMTKEQKKHGILGLIMILVLVGIFSYTKTAKQIPKAEDKSSNETPAESLTIPTNIEQNNTEKTLNLDNQSAFNAALKEGLDLFNAKKYDQSIAAYQKALKIKDSDIPYFRIYNVYAAENNWTKAKDSLDQAIKRNPLYTEYWIVKLQVMDEKLHSSFASLKSTYDEAYQKVDSRTKPNLVTTFARIAESNGMKDEAIAAWQKAIEIYPANKATYQAEIDRLKSL